MFLNFTVAFEYTSHEVGFTMVLRSFSQKKGTHVNAAMTTAMDNIAIAGTSTSEPLVSVSMRVGRSAAMGACEQCLC